MGVWSVDVATLDGLGAVIEHGEWVDEVDGIEGLVWATEIPHQCHRPVVLLVAYQPHPSLVSSIEFSAKHQRMPCKRLHYAYTGRGID